MKSHNFARFIPVFALVLSVAAFAQTGSAAAVPAAAGPTKVGIVNIQQAIVASNEGQRDFESLQKKFEPRQGELQNLNKEVEDLKKQLSTQGDKLNEDSRAQLVKSIESKQKSLQRSFEDAQNEFQAQQTDIANRIGQKMLGVLDKYAKDNGYGVILDVSSPQTPVLWAGPSMDVTQAIVDAYNTQSGVPAPARPAGAKPTTGAARPATSPATGVTRPATTPATKPAGSTAPAPSTTPK